MKTFYKFGIWELRLFEVTLLSDSGKVFFFWGGGIRYLSQTYVSVPLFFFGRRGIGVKFCAVELFLGLL